MSVNQNHTFIRAINPHYFDSSKLSFSAITQPVFKHSNVEYTKIKYDGNKLYVVARNCEIKIVGNKNDTDFLILKITDENFIKMIKEYDRILKNTAYNNRESWFNNNGLTFDNISQMLRPTIAYHERYGYSIACSLNKQCKKSAEYSLIKKNNSVDMCFLFHTLTIHKNDFCNSTCVIEKIEKIKYIGPWSINMHNETSRNFQKFIMTILLCNNKMKVPLCYDMIISIFEYLQTF